MSGNSFASELTGLYQAQLPVVTQTAAERKKIAPEILKKVLLKVVGDNAILNSTNLAPILSQADQFIQQYQYLVMNKMTNDLTQPDILELQLNFNENELNRSLIELGLPVWGASRPEILLWFAIEDSDGVRTIIGEESIDSDLSNTLKQASINRGLPLFMPLMDLQDQMQVKFSDLWAGFPEPILKASQRYNAPIIVIARVVKSEKGGMQIRWQSLSNNESEQWQSSGHEALSSGIAELADRTARRFTQTVSNQDGQRITLHISNVKGYTDYIRIKKYLSKLHAVSDVQLSNLANNRLEISILLSSNLASFNQMIALERVLEEDPNYHSDDAVYYKLVL